MASIKLLKLGHSLKKLFKWNFPNFRPLTVVIIYGLYCILLLLRLSPYEIRTSAFTFLFFCGKSQKCDEEELHKCVRHV